MIGQYIVAIDQSTAASKVFLLDRNGAIIKRCSLSHRQFYPAPGRVEHDAEEIWTNVASAIAEVTKHLSTNDLCAVSISNQRETTVIWDPKTGKPLCRALVWQDVRGEETCRGLSEHKNQIFLKTGLPLSPYYSAAKAASVLTDNPEIRNKAMLGEVCIGTVDSYLIYRLTGGERFMTDVSNASRTQLMNLQKLSWDDDLCRWFGIPLSCLPAIALSDGDFGTTNCDELPRGIPITGVMGDSHAALFGQGCLEKGMAKATYGTGSSVMMNVGDVPILSKNGLSASVGFGFKGKVCFVLEGNVISSGDTLNWLQDEAEWMDTAKEAQDAAATVSDTGGVYLVPAFSGLGAPYFQEDAKALICGISRGTRRSHILRAALESMAYQDCDIIDAMEKDIHAPLKELRVDGGPTANSLLMQFQSDVLDCPVQCAALSELSALGTGYMAGLATGLYSRLENIPSVYLSGRRYEPDMTSERRSKLLNGWHSAIQRAQFQPTTAI